MESSTALGLSPFPASTPRTELEALIDAKCWQHPPASLSANKCRKPDELKVFPARCASEGANQTPL
jgi:hypothetical protein